METAGGRRRRRTISCEASPEQKDAFRKLFRLIGGGDGNRNNEVCSVLDADSLLQQIGLNIDLHAANIRLPNIPADPDELTIDEFVKLLTIRVRDNPNIYFAIQEYMNEEHDLFDTYNSGGVNGANHHDEPVETIEIKVAEEVEEQSEDLRQAFRYFDQDGNGFISTAELSHVMKHLGLALSGAEITDMMQEADDDGDGEISFEDFYSCMKSIIDEGS